MVVLGHILEGLLETKGLPAIRLLDMIGTDPKPGVPSMLETPTADGLWPYVQDAPSFSAMCRTLNSLGVLGLPASVKHPIARKLCERLGFEPTAKGFANQLSPSSHSREYVAKSRATSRRSSATWKAANPDRVKSSYDAWCAANPERRKATTDAWFLANPDRKKELQADWYADHPGYRADYIRKRCETDPIFRMATRLRARLGSAIRAHRKATGKGIQKQAKTLELIGCSVEFLVAHIQAQFVDGMTWGTIEIDHIRPLASFERPDDPAAWHWTNLQPLTPPANAAKGSLWEGERHRFGFPPQD